MLQGHLLVIENFNSFKLNHGLMEAGYVSHQNATLESIVSDPKSVNHAESTSISMTATMDTMGNLILGNYIIVKVCFALFSLIFHLYPFFVFLPIFRSLLYFLCSTLYQKLNYTI